MRYYLDNDDILNTSTELMSAVELMSGAKSRKWVHQKPTNQPTLTFNNDNVELLADFNLTAVKILIWVFCRANSVCLSLYICTTVNQYILNECLILNSVNTTEEVYLKLKYLVNRFFLG